MSEGGQIKPNAVISSPDDPTYVETGVDVSFNGSTFYNLDGGDPQIKSYSWDFGDSTAYDTAGATSANAICKYSTAGVKTITLTVTDNDHVEGYPYDQTDSDTCEVTVVEVKMNLSKEGSTTIEAGNHYSENTTIRVTAVDGTSEDTLIWFTGPVNIAEDGTSIYTQNGGTLPSSVSITSGGTTTFVAKSLAGPKDDHTKPDTALITTDTGIKPYPVWGGTSLSIPQWTNDLGQVDSKSRGVVYDWFETRTKDIIDNATGDLATVLSKMSYYDQTNDSSYAGQVIDWDHTDTSGAHFNPHFCNQIRIDTPTENLCGQAVDKTHTDVVIHEARHCYQDYLSSDTNNDSDQDWLVNNVPIAPTTYLLDTGTSRAKCSGTDSFKGDAQYDDYSSGGTRTIYDNVIEKDACKYMDDND